MSWNLEGSLALLSSWTDRWGREGRFLVLEGLGLALKPPCIFLYDTKLSHRTINIAFTEVLGKPGSGVLGSSSPAQAVSLLRIPRACFQQ